MPHSLLYIEDDALLRQALARELRERFCNVELAGTLAEARAFSATRGPWCGFIVDHGLPDGTGLDLLEELHAAHPGVPSMLATGEVDLELARICAARDIRYLPKPFDLSHFEPLFEQIETFLARPDGPVFDAFSSQLEVTPRERDILRMSLLEAHTQRQIAEALHVSVNTVKTHVRSILSKAGARSMAELRTRLRSAYSCGRDRSSNPG